MHVHYNMLALMGVFKQSAREIFYTERNNMQQFFISSNLDKVVLQAVSH